MIEILMATYNGEKFLREQLDSLLEQTYRDFKILIRDDGSTDGTRDILSEYTICYPEKIKIIHDENKGGGAAKNFFHLINYATADYVMFCDQDDFWLPNKIEVTYKSMIALEKKHGKEKPALVFSSYIPVDTNLRKINLKEKNSQIGKYKLDFNHLLVQNYVTGCLMMCNRALYSKCGKFDDRILMHDWWLALLASSTGKIQHINDEVMLYRQHDNNQVGAVNVKSFNYRINKLLDKNTRNMQYLYLNQARLFYNRYNKILNNKERLQLYNFISIYQHSSKLTRMFCLIKGRYLKSDFVRIIGQLWYV